MTESPADARIDSDVGEIGRRIIGVERDQLQADRVDHRSDDAPAADQLDQREHRIGAPTELGLRGFHIAR